MTEEVLRLLKGSAATLEFAAMRLRILGDKSQAKVIEAQSATIRKYVSAQTALMPNGFVEP